MLNTHAREYILFETIGPQGLVLRETTIPPLRGSEVLVKIQAVSLNCRDLMLSRGQFPGGIKKHVIPCSDAAGEIVQIGVDVIDWKIGDRVCPNFSPDYIEGDVAPANFDGSLGGPVDGVLTEYRAFPAHSLVRIPEHLSYEEASTLPCAALTAYSSLMGPVKVKAGDHVLVQGTGGVSMFTLQMAVAAGAIVIVTSSDDSKLDIARSLGAKHTINYKKNPDWNQEVLKITNGLGVEHIVEICGPGSISKSVKAVKIAGNIHFVGTLAGIEGQADLIMILMKFISLRGIFVGSRRQFEDMNRLITASLLKPVVDKVFSFENASAAYEYLEGQKHVGKVVIKVAKD